MGKKLWCCILAGALILSLCGCGEGNQGTDGNSGTGNAEGSGTSAKGGSAEGETSDPAGEDLFLSLADLPWQDNSLDAYSAVLNIPLRYTEQDTIRESGVEMYVLGNTRASVFKKQIFPKPEDCWDEIKAVTDQGMETSFRLAFREGKINQAWAAGSVAGSDHYIMMAGVETNADGEFVYSFFETNEDMQVLNSFRVDCLDRNDYELPQQLQADAGGNLHMITSRFSGGTCHYYIVAPDGALLTEGSPRGGFPADNVPVLFPLYDGRVGLGFREQLQCVDPETGEAEILANIKPGYRGCILWDEKTLLYADGEGLYRSGLSGENPELLYAWSSHGVSVSEIKAMQVRENRDIDLIYMDGRGANYLKLTPTTEEVEIREITIGLSQGSGRKYQAVAAAFHKKYPAYRVEIKSYGYNDTNLLTELIAGKGPVLVDTWLVGFETNEEWWEPLDEVFRQLDPEEELIPQVVDAGRINGTLYGIVTDFSLDTMVTFAEEPEEWDYDTFLSCFDEGDSSMKSVLLPLNGSGGESFLAKLFFHGLQENYLFDAESCTTRFDSEEFRKILRLGRYFEEREHQGTSEDVRQGTSLCAQAYIDAPEDLACLRIWGGDKLRYVGYPSGEGSRHYIEGAYPIAVRANATAEEKQLAHSFLQFLLSHDAQMEAMSAETTGNYQMSVRRDVLEEQIDRINGDTYPNVHGFPQFHLGEQVDKELDRAVLYSLLEKAEPRQYMPRELVSIFSEELTDYLSGNLTEDVVIEHLENRVGLYLSEQK